MPKQMSGKTFSNLLDYYIACLEQEDMLSVTFNVSSEGIQFLSGLFQTEELLNTNNKKVTVELSEDAKRFFQTSLLQHKKNLFYGYPVLIGPGGTICPVFFIELNYEQQENNIVFTKVSDDLKINHHILSQYNFSSEEIINIQHEIEGEEFSESLHSLCEMLEVDSIDLSAVLDKKPLKRTITFKIINKVMIYFGDRTDITHNLIVELHQLKKKPIDDLASTSLILILTGEYQNRFENKKTKPLLEIFSLNPSQNHAVQKALTQALTVITGPPGTGKSQVVLNIIANAVYQNKTVLFASKNNKAVDVVIEKLNSILPYKLIVRMGHQGHRRTARSELEQLASQNFSAVSTTEKTIEEVFETATKMERVQNQLITMVALNESIETNQKTIDICCEQLPEDLLRQMSYDQLEAVDTHLLQEDLKKFFGHHSILHRVYSGKILKNQERCFSRYYSVLSIPMQKVLQHLISNKNATLESALQWILMLKKIGFAAEEIQDSKKRLLSMPSYISLKNQLMALHHEQITLSRPIFEAFWLKKLSENIPLNATYITSYFSTSEQLESWVGDQTIFKQLCSEQVRTLQKILTFLPVWVVTNLSAKKSFPLKNNLFDILIIDEASQCDIVSAIPLLYRAKHVAIIGDPHQLSHISLLNETQDRTLALAHGLSEEWFVDFSYTKHSLYNLAEHIADEHHEEPLLLNEHYRCHSDIISFSNDYYYGRKLIIATDEKRLLQHPLITSRILWQNVKGKTLHTKSPYNEIEAEKVAEEILRILGSVPALNASVGIVTLFRAQTEIIAQKLKIFSDVYHTDIVIGTAHKFQGDERDIIVFSPAVSADVKPGTLHWIQTTSQLLNVAITRARSLFIIVGDHEVCSQATGPLQHLAEYAETMNRKNVGFTVPYKQVFFEELMKHKIPVVSHYCILGKTPTQIDFALFVNGNRYAITIDSEEMKTDMKHIRNEGWKVRRFSEQDIIEKPVEVIEEINRLC